jgi:hypothetical protein
MPIAIAAAIVFVVGIAWLYVRMRRSTAADLPQRPVLEHDLVRVYRQARAGGFLIASIAGL